MEPEQPKGEIDTTLMMRRARSMLTELVMQSRDESMDFFMTAYIMSEYNRCDAAGIAIDEVTIKEEAYEYLEAYMRGEQLHPRLPRKDLGE